MSAVKLMARIVVCLGTVTLLGGATCGGGTVSNPVDVDAKLKEIIEICRGGELNQLPSESGAGQALGTGLACPSDRVTDLNLPTCERNYDFTVEIEGKGTTKCSSTVTLKTTSHKRVDHSHQAVCDTAGTCAAEYVERVADVNASIKASCTLVVNGTPFDMDVTGRIGGYNDAWRFYDKVDHGGDRTCGPKQDGECAEVEELCVNEPNLPICLLCAVEM